VDEPNIRTLAARVGAYSLHAQRDPKITTARARAAFLARFVDEVDPERKLPEAERLRRAEYAKSAYFARLALASAKARRRKAQAATAKDGS
jgi:hypothetical protein